MISLVTTEGKQMNTEKLIDILISTERFPYTVGFLPVIVSLHERGLGSIAATIIQDRFNEMGRGSIASKIIQDRLNEMDEKNAVAANDEANLHASYSHTEEHQI